MIPLFDAHCDTASKITARGLSLRENDLSVDLESCRAFSPHARVFAIFNDLSRVADIEAAAVKQMDYLLKEISENCEIVALCTDGRQARAAFSQGKIAAFLSVEGAEQLGCSAAGLKWAYGVGVRAVNITWNHANALSGSHCDAPERGLSDAGRDFVRACNELGVIIDVSHISGAGFWDVLEASSKPIIASHSNSRAVWEHTRNLTDAQFEAIARSGGAVGINLYERFLGEGATVDTVVGHIEHFLALGGEKSVGIGSDFDGCSRLPAGIRRVSDLSALYEALLRRNYPQSLVNDIFFNNMMRAFEF